MLDAALLEVVGKVAGIGGLGLGVFLLLFRNLIRKLVFPQLTREQAFHIIKMMLWFIFSIAFAGILAWLVSQYINKIPVVGAAPALSPSFSAFFDSNKNLLLKNSGGPAFNIERDSRSELRYNVATSDDKRLSKLEVARSYSQPGPGIHSVGGLDGYPMWVPVDRTLLLNINREFCAYIVSKELSITDSWLTLKIVALLKYDDERGQQHRRAWVVVLSGFCPPTKPIQVSVSEGNASDFKNISSCHVLFPISDSGRITSEAIRKVMVNVIEGNGSY